MNSSYYERSAWIQLAALLAVLSVAGAVVGSMLNRGDSDIASYGWVYLIAYVALIIVVIVGHIGMSILSVTLGNEDAETLDKADERDKVISWRANAYTSWIVGATVAIAVIMLVFDASPIWVANVLVAGSFVAEIAKQLVQLFWYRVGSAMPC